MKSRKFIMAVGIIGVFLCGCQMNQTTKDDSGSVKDDVAFVEEDSTEETDKKDAVSDETQADAPIVKIENIYYEMEEEEFWQYFNGYYELAEVSGTGYEALAASVEEWFQNYETSYKEQAKTIYEDTKAYEEIDSEVYNPSYMNNRVVTARADNRIVSFRISEEEYAGGAHGSTYDYGLTFDAQTGKELTLSDLGDVKEDIKAYINDVIAQDSYIAEDIITDDYETIVNEAIDSESSWYLTGNGVVVIFNEYELLNYAAGDYVVTIPYENLKNFNEEYECGESYFTLLTEYESVTMDLGRDGTMDTISLDCQYSEEGYKIADVNINGNKVTAHEYCYSVSGYIMHTKEGNDYILVCAEMENDYVQTALIGIENGEPVLLDSDGFDILGVSGENLWTRRKVDMLGSYLGYCNVVIQEDGFQPIEERYTYNIENYDWDYALIVKKELPCKLMVDGELKDATLDAGTKIAICDSDGEGVAGFQLEDGTYGEIQEEISDNQRLINGTDENEFFEQLPYAG